MSQNTNTTTKKEYDNIGALWERTSKTGKRYLTGKKTIDGKEVQIVAFRIEHKRSENTPDYSILESKPKPETEYTDEGILEKNENEETGEIPM
jgi:uncharacterized protein (DUF736 family)